MDGSSVAVPGLWPRRSVRRWRRVLGWTVAPCGAILYAFLFASTARAEDPPIP